MSVSYFYVYKDVANLWRWRFAAKNGKTIADSAESYINLVDCEHGISLLKEQCNESPVIGDDSFKRLRP